MPETNPGVGKGFEVQLKVEDINEEPLITPAMVKAAFSLGKSRYACVGSSGIHLAVVPLFLSKIGDHPELGRVLSPDQLNCANHPFFEGLHPLSPGAKGFCNCIFSSESYSSVVK